MREEAADLDVDLECALIALLHRGLDDLEALGQLHLLRELEAELLGEPVDGLLRERHRTDAGIARPFAAGSLRVEVDRCERELGDAASERAVRIDVADSLGGAHRDAEDALLAHRDHASEGGDVTVVVDLERHAPVALDAEEHVLRNRVLLGVLLLDGAEEAGDAHLLADEGSGGRAADRVHARQRRGGFLEAGGEHRVVVLGIGVVARIPRELLGEHDLAFLEGGDLEVARAEVEADTAAVGDGLHLREGLLRLGHLLERDDDGLDGAAVEIREESIIERARALLRVGLRDGLHDGVGTGEVELPSAGGPHDELRDAVDNVADLLRSLRVKALRNRQIVAEDLSVFTFPRDCDNVGLRANAIVYLPERAHRGDELGVTFALLATCHDLFSLVCFRCCLCLFHTVRKLYHKESKAARMAGVTSMSDLTRLRRNSSFGPSAMNGTGLRVWPRSVIDSTLPWSDVATSVMPAASA